MNNNQTVTGVVLTLNEEAHLSRALVSLSWCDEVLVVDSGSTDRTAEVAKDCGARFVQHIQEPPFLITEQRNWALEYAGISSDWVVFLDADEVISDQTALAIINRIHLAPADVVGFEMSPRYWFLGCWLKHTQQYPSWHPRIVRRGRVKFYGGVWEEFSTREVIARIPEPYEHYAFSKGLDDWVIRHLRYSDWDAATTIEYLKTGNRSDLLTSRQITRRTLSAKLWPIKPLTRFIQKYLLNLGFLDGWAGLIFSFLMSTYELFVVIKIVDLLRRTSTQTGPHQP